MHSASAARRRLRTPSHPLDDPDTNYAHASQLQAIRGAKVTVTATALPLACRALLRNGVFRPTAMLRLPAPCRVHRVHPVHRVPAASTTRQTRHFIPRLFPIPFTSEGPSPASSPASPPLAGSHPRPPHTQVFSAARTLPYPALALYRVITDVRSYASFVPYCASSVVTRWTPPDAHLGHCWPADAVLAAGWGGIHERFASSVFCVPARGVVVAIGRAEGAWLRCLARDSGTTSTTTSGEGAIDAREQDAHMQAETRKKTTEAREGMLHAADKVLGVQGLRWEEMRHCFDTGDEAGQTHDDRAATEDGDRGPGALLTHLLTRWTVTPVPEPGLDGARSSAPAAASLLSRPSSAPTTGSPPVQTQIDLSIEFAFANPLYTTLSAGAAPRVAETMIRAFEERVGTVLGQARPGAARGEQS